MCNFFYQKSESGNEHRKMWKTVNGNAQLKKGKHEMEMRGLRVGVVGFWVSVLILAQRFPGENVSVRLLVATLWVVSLFFNCPF